MIPGAVCALTTRHAEALRWPEPPLQRHLLGEIALP